MKSIVTFFLIVFSSTLFAQKGLNDFTFKRPFRVVATSDITLSGTQTIDGVSLNVDDRVLLTGQSTGSQNGPMVVKSGTWVRPVDFNDTYDAKSGMFAVVEEGTINGNTIWMLTTNNPITLGTTSLTFVKTYPSASGIATVSAGSGISISGTTDVTVSATDASVTNETLADNNQTLSGSRTVTINGNDLGVLGSTYRTFWSAAGNFGVSNDAFTPFNTVHVKHSGTSGLSGIVGRGHTITANNATPPSIYFESPDLTDGSQVMGIQFVTNSGLGLWKLASFNDAGSSATVDNVIAATHAGFIGFGIVPVVKHHIHVPAATTAVLSKWSNTTTGATTVDGFDIGISNANPAVAQLINRESSDMQFHTGNTNRFVINSAAATLIGQGATTYTSTGATTINAASNSDINISSLGTGNVNLFTATGGDITLTGQGTNGVVTLTTNGSGGIVSFNIANTTSNRFVFNRGGVPILEFGNGSGTDANSFDFGTGTNSNLLQGINFASPDNSFNAGAWYKNSTTGGGNDGLATYVLSGATPTARIHQYENEDLEFYTNNTKRVVLENDGDLGLGVDNPAQKLDITGNLQLNTAGNKLLIKEGTNASLGVETLVGGTKTVNTTAVTANSRIFVTIQTVGGTPGVLYIGTRTAGTSFDVISTSGSDTSTFAWWIVEPAP